MRYGKDVIRRACYILHPLPEHFRVLGINVTHSRAGPIARWTGKHRRTAEVMRSSVPFLGMCAPAEMRQRGRLYWQMWSPRSRLLTVQRERWYPDGKKHPPSDIELHPETVYWWYVGDGHLIKRSGCITLGTYGFLKEEVELLAHKLDSLGFSPSVHYHLHSRGYYIYIPRRCVTAFLDYLGPCQNPEYAYKWESKSG